jgi:hypothetical protein
MARVAGWWLVVAMDEEHRIAEWDEARDFYRAAVRDWTAAHGDPIEVPGPYTGQHQTEFTDPDDGRPVTFSIRFESNLAEDTEDHWPETSVWYPDVAAIGDASRAWQAELDRLGSPHRVRRSGGGNASNIAQVGDGREHWAGLTLSPWERQFRLHLHAGEKPWPAQLEGNAPDLAAAAVAAHLWLERVPWGELALACPFLGSVALAEAKERGDEREHSWLELSENPMASKVAARLAPFIALAIREPRLRVLRPYTSVWTLTFSSSPTWPFTGTHPDVTPVEQSPPAAIGGPVPDGYVVHHRGRSREVDAPGALAFVLAELED